MNLTYLLQRMNALKNVGFEIAFSLISLGENSPKSPNPNLQVGRRKTLQTKRWLPLDTSLQRSL